MYGKIFDSTFTGSMLGSGCGTFAIWSYILAKTGGDHRVELNPEHLAVLIGMPPKDAGEIIQKFCAPDPRSRSKEEEGRRLIHEGGFIYFVVNHEKYLKIQNEEGRREYWRNAQKASRERRKQEGTTGTQPVEVTFGEEGPPLQEVITYGSTQNFPEPMCRDFHNWYSEKKMWLNGYQKPINWKMALVRWREKEKTLSKPARVVQYDPSAPNPPRISEDEYRRRERKELEDAIKEHNASGAYKIPELGPDRTKKP